jgi:hypothetical protein
MNCQAIRSKFFALLLTGLCIIPAIAQDGTMDYAREWKKVEAFAKKNLPRSALAEVTKIYALAKKDQQDAQVIKALIYISGLQSINRENNELFSIQDIEKEINTARQPAVSILKSILAEIYWSYYKQHQWQLYDRTKTVNYKFYDIDTWGIEDFHKKMSELYLASIENEKLLQQIPVDAFNAIVIKGNTRSLRPTLYDLLANRAVGYFRSDERGIRKPAYAFEMDQASFFSPAMEFVTKKIVSSDSLSLQHKALLVYQQLIAFHLADADPAALIDADIKRIEYVKNQSVHPDKDSLFIAAIRNITRRHPDHPEAAKAWWLIARDHEYKAARYKAYGDSTYRYDNIQAKNICEKVLQQKTESEGWISCYNMLKRLTRQELKFQLEKVNIPGQSFRAFVQYYNLPTVYLRVVKEDEKLNTELGKPKQEFWQVITKASPLKQWEQALPSSDDLQSHSTEIKIDGLAPGTYWLLAATDKDFQDTKTTVIGKLFYVSGISYIFNNKEFFVLDRDNGQPLAGASVKASEQVRDYKTRENKRVDFGNYTTDDHGYFKLSLPVQVQYGRHNYSLDITYKNDRLSTHDDIYDYFYVPGKDANTPEIITSVFFFTDRSIYRPGQQVYLKGIVFGRNTTTNARSILNNYTGRIYLRNANNQHIDSLEVKTNEYGSFSGKFRLPETGMNGRFSILTKDHTNSVYFNVEEYKRPKFSIDYERIKGVYKVNDSVKITGIAKAYAGNAIDDATVKYRVVRQPRFIYSWLYRGPRPAVNEVEIAHGEIRTGDDGKFVVSFMALPDLSVDPKYEPVFDYKVYADVTDINGETRSGSKTVSVSYRSIVLRTNVPKTLPVDSLKSLFIRTENMNGEFEPANVKVIMTRLREEKRLIRDRLWERSDQFVMSKEEYIRYFPNDEYDNETDQTSWQKEEKVLDRSDSARLNGEWKTGNGKYKPGVYIIEITTNDKDGTEIKDVRYIELIDEKIRQLNYPQYLWANRAEPVEPGETATVNLGTSADNLFVIHELTKEKKGTAYNFFQLNKEKKDIDFTVTESDRGGFGVSWFFVKHNRVYQYRQSIDVPWTNKELKIEYATYRDKTLPGSEEKWKLRITGYKKEKLAAEMLAGMYDASLDQFYEHNWNRPSIWPSYYNSRIWSNSNDFRSIQSMPREHRSPTYKNIDRRYDAFMSSYVFTPHGRRGDIEPLWWANPLDYAYSEARNPRLMRLPKPLLYESDGDGFSDEDVMADWSRVRNFQHDMNPDVRWQADDVAPFRANRFVSLKEGKRGEEDFVIRRELKIISSDEKQEEEIKIRKNFNETAFFFPDLRTDSSGAIEFSFTMPESLTKWKFMALAHTKEGAFGRTNKEIITQKQLMVQPNMPRFLRENDKIEFSSKIVNLGATTFKGTAELQLADAATNEAVNGLFKNKIPNQSFTIASGQSAVIKFPLEIPAGFNKALVWRIIARAKVPSLGGDLGAVSDGEENTVPVLTNRTLVTETMPLFMRGAGTKHFDFDKLRNSGSSTTLRQHALTLEYTSNPAWYAVQALPYLMEYPYECAEQTWNRYYANSLASMIVNSSPRMKEVFEQWKITDTAALVSNLEKNSELKALLLEETPWVLQAKTESQQKKNIALLFDLLRMNKELNGAYRKLEQMQKKNGGFAWFNGGEEDPYITQYIVTGIGHLKKLNAYAKGQDDNLSGIVSSAISYLDKKIKEDYDELKKNKADLKEYTPGESDIQYLYMRSFFPEYKMPAASQTAYNFFRERAQKTWIKQSIYMQGMLVLALGRTGDTKTPAAILASLKETAVINDELGMYWKNQSHGWFWYEAPVETQSLLIEAFQEIGQDTKAVDDLRTWLLKNKQTNNWSTTKATAEACYALLLQGTNWLTDETLVQIQLGGYEGTKKYEISSNDFNVEKGTGYFKKTIDGKDIFPEMGRVAVTVGGLKSSTGNGLAASTFPTWGGVYWQYFEDLDKITTAATPLKLVKKLFVETNTDRGPVLTPVNDGDKLKVGDKIKVRVELRVDRDMEYVHMKDMRASALEPVNVLSSYKWQGGLGYYESTKDASTNFFFSHLRKGAYVFEYTLFVTHAGNFSNGITTIQCMYAPEFSSHSEGVRISVE